MMDEQDEDAVFDRLAKSLEAVRQDAELVRSHGAEAMKEGIARAETELRALGAAIEALCQRVEQQQVEPGDSKRPRQGAIPTCRS